VRAIVVSTGSAEEVGLLQERVRGITRRCAEELEVGTWPARERWPLARAAQVCDAELVVVGSSPTGGVVEWLRGGDAAEVIRHGRSAVLVVKPGPRTGHVLCATDLSDPSYPAVATAAGVCRRSGARLTVLHCLEDVTAWGPGEIGGGALAYTEPGPPARAALERAARARLRSALAANSSWVSPPSTSVPSNRWVIWFSLLFSR